MRYCRVLTLALLAACVSLPGEVGHLVVARKQEVLGVLAREPMIVQHPGGALLASGYGGEDPKLWRSDDDGITWTRVSLGGTAAGAIGNSDVDLAVARDGTIYIASMSYDRVANIGIRIAVGASSDMGATWTWTTISETRGDDRPWIEVAPDGTAHVIWNDGAGVSHAVSRDRGRTWTRDVRVSDRGGSSHLAVGPRGEVAVRVTPASKSGFQFDADVDFIAVSDDGGKSWRRQPAPGNRNWKSADDERWVEPIAWDDNGALYSFWAEGPRLMLARSEDKGASWTQRQLATGRDTAFFPYVVAHGDGELAATWFTRSDSTLQWHAALISQSSFVETAPLPTESFAAGPKPSDPPTPDAAGEYVGVTFLRGGGIGVVTPIRRPSAQRVGFTFWKLSRTGAPAHK